MKKNDVIVGPTYTGKVSDRLVSVRVDSAHSKQGWNARNTATGKRVDLKSAQCLREHGKPATNRPSDEGIAAGRRIIGCGLPDVTAL